MPEMSEMKDRRATHAESATEASCDCEALRAQLAQVDAILNVLDSDPTSRICAIEYLIDRADGVEPATGEDLPDLEAAVSLMAAQRDEMFDVHRDTIFRAQAAMELIAELAMPDRALRREVRMRGVTAVVYDRMDKISGCLPRDKIASSSRSSVPSSSGARHRTTRRVK